MTKTFEEGQRVQVVGFYAHPSYQGKVGTVSATFLHNSVRWARVALDDAEPAIRFFEFAMLKEVEK